MPIAVCSSLSKACLNGCLYQIKYDLKIVQTITLKAFNLKEEERRGREREEERRGSKAGSILISGRPLLT